MTDLRTNRRQFMLLGGTAAATLLAETARAKPKDEEEVPSTEDLMREHGVLRRILLVYREVVHRLDAKREVKSEWVSNAATIIRDFIEDYHEKDEEEYVFPRLQKAGKLVDLVSVLLAQHQAGRRVTEQVLRLATPAGLRSDTDRAQLAEVLRGFARMYEPHAAREDTVLFPAFRDLLSERELKKLQDLFEDKEKALPHGGFEKMVTEVAKIEKAIGIYDLAQFTPKV
jgi:hemerythrin-like domain-containing protein